MPDFDFEARCDATLMAIKKLMAANGRLVGGYALWATPDVKTGALVVSHKGIGKAQIEGKAIKKELRGSKQIAAGQILISNRKIYLLNTEGSSAKVSKFITRVIAPEYKKLGFLKKFKWTTEEEVEGLLSAQNEGDGAPDEDAVSLADLKMTEEDMAALRAELEADEELKEFFSDTGMASAIEKQNREMNASMSKIKDREQARADVRRKEMAMQRERIAQLTGEDRAGNSEQLQEAREEYSRLSALGVDPVPDRVGDQVAPEILVLMQGVNEEQTLSTMQLHERIAAYLRALNDRAAELLTDEDRIAFFEENQADIIQHGQALMSQKTNYEKIR